ncbi:fibronectin type III domain-containing protein [Candidatus Poriferisocius sp.]|uniref:fibronectin type III domain-containing protein n=1 Tax=Candidatus Poriferisocius sp. TaxID=3101276 RepID=UPI003B02295F
MRAVVSLGAVLAVLGAVLASGVSAEDRFSATWTYVEGEEPQGVFVGNELLLPPCVPDAGRAATAEAGVVKFVMCPDHLQIESVATSSDITFYPEFSPDRHSYVVHVADSVSEVRFDPIFRTSYPGTFAHTWPGFAYAMVGSSSSGNNIGKKFSASVKMSPGVTTLEIGVNQWFMRYGKSQAEYDRRNGGPTKYGSWTRDSGKIARTRYKLELVWKSPDTPLVAPAEVTPIGTVDYDTDDDGLVEVSTLAQLEAVRWDADGDGYSDHGGPLHVGFPNALAQMGCPSSGCVGYELAGDLDFDTNASGDADEGDDFWNSGHGWVPIGADTDHFSGVFEGNGHTISNLFINSDDVTVSPATGYYRVDGSGRYIEQRSIHLGLFEELARGGVIRNVGLADVSVTRTFPCMYTPHPLAGDLCVEGRVGGLVGVSAGTIRGSWVTGTVSNTITQSTGLNKDLPAVVGGLVGQAHSSSVIAASFASADVSADMDPWNGGPGNRVGGLVGINAGAITASYATGTAHSGINDRVQLGVYSKSFAGGLVGHNSGSITASYVSNTVSGGVNHPMVGRTAGASRVHESYWDAGDSSGWHSYSKGSGFSSAELQAPTDYTGIYANWNVDLDSDGSADDPWDFGTSSDYPTLNNVGPGSNQQVGADADQQKQQKQKRQPQASGEVPGPVTALALTATSNTVTVSWQPPEVGGAPKRYIVHLKPEGGKKGSGKTKDPKAKKTKVTFKNLKPGTTYNVWVRAQNQHGKSDRLSNTITLPQE